MRRISKRILTDEAQQPVAVQIEYADWLEIERLLANALNRPRIVDFSKFFGVIELSEDPLEYQRRIRDEWER